MKCCRTCEKNDILRLRQMGEQKYKIPFHRYFYLTTLPKRKVCMTLKWFWLVKLKSSKYIINVILTHKRTLSKKLICIQVLVLKPFHHFAPKNKFTSFIFKFLEDTSPFCGATDNPVLDFWWHLSWVSKPGWISCLCAFSPVVIIRFTSGVTPADCMEVSMVVEPLWSSYLQIMCPQALVGVWTHNCACHSTAL